MITILDTDTRFTTHAEVGWDCICSRCGLPILTGIPICAWPQDCSYEYRFHGECLGFQSFDDDDPDYVDDEFPFDLPGDELVGHDDTDFPYETEEP